MKKKKVEVLFRAEFGLDEKKVTKDNIKAHLEGRIKGLKVERHEITAPTKDMVRVEVTSNFLALLNANLDELPKTGPPKSGTAGRDEAEDSKDGGQAADKLLEGLRGLLGQLREKGKRKAVLENMDKLLSAMEMRAVEAVEQCGKVAKENVHMKAALDNLMQVQTVNMNQMNQALSAAQMDQTAILIQNLRAENERLMKQVLDYQEELKVYQRSSGDKVFLDKVKALEKEMADKDALHKSEIKDIKEQCQLAKLELMDSKDKIKEMEDILKGENKDEVVIVKKQLETVKAKLKETDANFVEAEKEVTQLKSKLTKQEEFKKEITAELAKALGQIAQQEEDIQRLTKVLAESKKAPSTPFMLAAAQTDGEAAHKVPSNAEELQPGPDILGTGTKTEAGRGPGPETGTASEAKAESRAEEGKKLGDDGKEGSEGRVRELETQLKRRDNKLSHLTALLSEKDEELNKLIEDYKQVQQYYLNYEREHKTTQMQMESWTGDKRALEAQVAAARADVANAAILEAELRARLSAAEQQLDAKERERSELRKAVEERNQIISSNEDRFIELESAKEDLELTVESLRMKVELAKSSGQGTATMSEDNVAELQLKVEQFQNTLKILDEDHKAKCLELKACQEELAALRTGQKVAPAVEAPVAKEKVPGVPESELQATVAENAKTIAELQTRVKELTQRNESLCTLIAVTNADTTKLLFELEAKDATIAELSAHKPSLKLDGEDGTGNKGGSSATGQSEAKGSSEGTGAKASGFMAQLTELRRNLELKNQEATKLQQDLKALTDALANERAKHKEELATLKGQLEKAEAQTKEQAELSSSAKSSHELRKQELEQKQRLVAEQLRMQQELDKQQAANQSLGREVREKEAELGKKNREIAELQERLKKLAEKGSALEVSSEATGTKSERVTAASDPSKGEEQKQKSSQDNLEYLNELVYLYKTLISSSKERIEEKKHKIERIQAFNQILHSLSDSKITKEKLRTIVTNSLHNFPYLTKFDLKNDYKYIVLSLALVLSHLILSFDLAASLFFPFAHNVWFSCIVVVVAIRSRAYSLTHTTIANMHIQYSKCSKLGCFNTHPYPMLKAIMSHSPLFTFDLLVECIYLRIHHMGYTLTSRLLHRIF